MPLSAQLSPIAGVSSLNRSNEHNRFASTNTPSLQHRVTPIAQVDPNHRRNQNLGGGQTGSALRKGNSALNVFKESPTPRRQSPPDKVR